MNFEWIYGKRQCYERYEIKEFDDYLLFRVLEDNLFIFQNLFFTLIFDHSNEKKKLTFYDD